MNASGKISQQTVDGLRPPASGTRKLSDGKGLFVLVHANGRRYWLHKYRYNGKTRTISYGDASLVTLAAARERHHADRVTLAKGVDPMSLRDAASGAGTHKAQALQFLAEASEQECETLLRMAKALRGGA